MAYILGDSGPRPHRAGEFFANWDPAHPVIGQRDSDCREPNWSLVRRGRPRPAGGRTSAQMSELGWIGLYLTDDLPLPQGAVEVATPDWMKEPQA